MKSNLLPVLLFAGIACASAQADSIRWLVGTWKLDGKGVYEVWRPQEGSGNLTGLAFALNGRDTTVTETISLKYIDGAFYYIPDVAGHQPPVPFRVTAMDVNSFTAENPEHDFPKVIRYKHIRQEGKEIMRASIEGAGKVITFSFTKIP